MRVVQPKGCRGSLKWIQHFVNQHPAALDKEILRQLDGAGKITWVSPLADDEFAEYRDADFLRQVGLERLARPLAEFWPRRGPQWDALARTDHDDVLLIEAKAHVPELHSPPSGAGAASLEKIQKAFSEAAKAYAVSGEKPWHKEFYQLANRLAHLYFLRKHSVSAWLVLVNFVGDSDMRGPRSKAEWEAAYTVAFDALGLAPEAAMLRHVLHVYLDVSGLA